jgi:hypothetical protein
MGCGTNIVPGFNESNKIKDLGLEMKINQEADTYDMRKSADTQIPGTLPTYRKVMAQFFPNVKGSDMLDYGAGKGLATKEFKMDSFEPYPEEGFIPDYTAPYEINKQYEGIVSNAVLNVLPMKERVEAVQTIGRSLKVGGRAVVLARTASELKSLKDPEPYQDGLVSKGKGTFQKGFTHAELQSFVQSILGTNFRVERVKEKIGSNPILITRLKSDVIDASQSNSKDYIKEAEKRLDEKEKRDRQSGKVSPRNIDDELLADEVDHEALRVIGAELPKGAEGVTLGDDGSSHSPVHKGSYFNGRYMWFLYGGTRGNALQYLLNWGRPSRFTWNSNKNLRSGLGKKKTPAFYDSHSDRIVSRTYAHSNHRGTVYGDVLRTLLHETFHWADFALGRHRYPRENSLRPAAISVKDPAFLKAFYLDAKELGLTDHDKAHWWNKSEYFIDSTHDKSLAEMILMDYLLDHPKILERMNPPSSKDKVLTLSQQFNLTNKRPSTLKKKYGTEFQKYYFDDVSKGILAKYIDKYAELPDRATLNSMYKIAERNVAHAKEMIDDRGVGGMSFTYARTSIAMELQAESQSLGRKEAGLYGYMDILDAMSGGTLNKEFNWIHGHGMEYYEGRSRRLKETFANLGEAWSNIDSSAWKRMKKKLPNLTREFERIMEENSNIRIERGR